MEAGQTEPKDGTRLTLEESLEAVWSSSSSLKLERELLQALVESLRLTLQ